MPHAVILNSHPDDYQIIRSYLTEIREKLHPQGTVYESGQFLDSEQVWDVSIGEIDESNINASSETERAINFFKPDVILFIGSATGIKDVKLGDVIIATKIYSYESGVDDNNFRPLPETKEPSYRLKERAKSEQRKNNWLKRLPETVGNLSPSILLKPIASGSKQIDSTESLLLSFLQLQYSDAVAVEQFGFGFFSAVSTNSTLSLTIHGITDVIKIVDIDPTFSRVTAVKNATAFAFEILSKYKPSCNEIVTFTPEIIIDTIKNSIADGLYDNSENLVGDRHRRIDYGRDLLKEEKFNQAYEYLNELKDDIWDTCNDSHKHRILVYIGMSLLQTDKTRDGALKLIDALIYNKDDDKALAIAAQGFFVLGDYIQSEENINKSLEKNPNNKVAYSTKILIASPEESIESILDKIPLIYREEADILKAMGWASLERELYERAVFYWQAALASGDNNKINSNIKGCLGFALLKPIANDYAVIATRQISDFQRNNLEQAIKLFDEVLGGSYLDPNELLGVKFLALSNRASSLRLLGRGEEAIRDINIILQKYPNDPQWIKQQAFIAHESGNNVDAYKYIQNLISATEHPDLSIFAAIYLLELNRYQEAENILNSLIKSNISADTRSEANHLKFIIYMKCNDQQKAQEILENLTEVEPDKLLTIMNYIQWEKKFGSEEKIPDLINQAKILITLRSSVTEKINLSNILYSFGYYRDAIYIYEKFVDTSINTLYSRRLLKSYFNSGDYKSSLRICNQLLEKDQSILTAAEISAWIYCEIGNRDISHQICENYLSVDPKNVRMQLLSAISDHYGGDYTKVDGFLDSNPSTTSLSLNHYKNLANLYKIRNGIDKFLETIYEIRHHFYDDITVHSFYCISYLDISNKKGNKDFLLAVDGCGILVRNESNQEQWYILDQFSIEDSTKYILDKDQFLYQSLIRKKVGDKIVLKKHSFGESYFIIIKITDKYLAASAQSLSILATRPDVENFQVFPAPESEQDINEWVQKLILSSQEFQDNFEQIKSRYIYGSLPLGAIACLFHRSPINIWNSLAFEVSPFIHTWSNFKHEKIEDSIISLQKGGLVVIDMISLLTLHHLQVMDEVVLVLGKIGISQSTVDIFHCAIEETKGIQSNGFASFSAEEGYGVMEEVKAEQVSQYRESLQYIFDWIKINCQILPCNRALDINQEKRRDLNKTIGSAFVDTVLIASEPNRILYSDDQWLRWYGKLEYGVCGTWTQVILKYCLTQNKISKSLYYQSIFKLISLGYSYTLLDSDILMESVRLYKWQVNPVYCSVLNAFTQNDIQHVTYVIASFLRQLYLESIIVELIDPRDMLVLELLKILTIRFPSGIFITELRRSIEYEFELIPIQKENLVDVINLWISQSVIV